MLEKELDIAIEAAYEAGLIQLNSAETVTGIQRKSDRSPVTEVDRKCEKIIRDTVLSAFPQDGFLGEESGSADSSSGRRWIVDPLDGTRPYIRGIPTYSALIALEDHGEPVLGVIHLPAQGITCYAVKGQGAFLNGEPIRVSSTPTLDMARGSVLGMTEYSGKPEGEALLELMRSWDYTYGFMDAYTYVLLASGKIDACVNLLDKAWDCAAAACIIREAGGAYSSIKGDRTVHGGSVVFSNGNLHADMLQILQKSLGK